MNTIDDINNNKKIANNSFNLLNMEFERIKNMGWIQSKRKGTGGIGNTFELLLNKKEDGLPYPDYYNIEIKTNHVNSKSDIGLFSLTPTGDHPFPIERILNKVGYPDDDYFFFDKLNIELFATVHKKMGYGRYLFLDVNDESKQIILKCIRKNNVYEELYISWSYDAIMDRLYSKLKYLAFISAFSKKVNGIEFFKYIDIKYYKLKSFDVFKDLLKKGDISITFKIGHYKTKEKFGLLYDHGTTFKIKKCKINALFEEIDFIT